MPFCRGCGKEVQDDWATCPYCSENLPNSNSANVTDSVVMGDVIVGDVEMTTTYNKEQKKSWKYLEVLFIREKKMLRDPVYRIYHDGKLIYDSKKEFIAWLIENHLSDSSLINFYSRISCGEENAGGNWEYIEKKQYSDGMEYRFRKQR